METIPKSFEIKPTMSNNSCSDDKKDDIMIDGAELLAAASEGRTDDAIKILEKDPTLIQVGDLAGDTALQAAMKAGHVQTVTKIVEFLDKGDHLELLAEVFCKEFALRDAASHLALKAQFKETARSLVLGSYASASASASEVDNEDVSPFELAQEEYDEMMGDVESLDVTKYFLPVDIEMGLANCALSDEDSNEAAVDNKDEARDENEGRYEELYEAVGKGREEVVMRMLEEDPGLMQSRDPHSGYNVIEMAASCGHLNIIKKVMQLGRVIKKSSGKTALQLAVENGHNKAAVYLIDANPDAAFTVDPEGVSPLILAVEKGYPDLVRDMIRTNICKSTREWLVQHAKRTFLAHLAIKHSNLEMLRTLMDGLPDLIHATDRKGWKPLSYAAYRGHLDEVCYILKSFPESIGIYDADGTLPIHKAVAGGHVTIVKEFLLSFPKTLYHVDKKGRNLLNIATKYKCMDVVSYLREQKEIGTILD